MLVSSLGDESEASCIAGVALRFVDMVRDRVRIEAEGLNERGEFEFLEAGSGFLEPAPGSRGPHDG